MIETGKDKIEDLFSVAEGLCIASTRQQVPLYDFDFRQFFQVSAFSGVREAALILRIGPIHGYEEAYDYFASLGLKLINSVEEHERVSLLPFWYPHLKELTPASQVFESIPDASQVELQFPYPVFLKGERQTHKHKKELCVAHDRRSLENILKGWQSDPILNWQRLIVRDFVELMPVEKDEDHRLRKAFEVRTFVWFGKVAGKGQYWESSIKIKLSPADESRINELAALVYARLAIPFMVIDFAKTISGDWIIIELNDAQESGYAMTPKIGLWNKIIELGADAPTRLRIN